MSAGSLRDSMADIGTTLREARMRARIDITEVENATKIRARFLLAIENEEWDALPGAVYARSFLRTYADYLGLDGRLLVDEYKRRYEPPIAHDPRPPGRRRRDRERIRRRPRVPPWAPVVVVLVAVVVGLYFLGLSPQHKTPTPAPPRPATRPAVHAKPRPARHRAPTTVTLQLTPTGPVYVCLVDGSGKPLIPGRILTPGQSVPTEKASKLLLTLGNAAVQLKVNGKSLNVAPAASAIGLELTPHGTAPLPPSQQPRCT